MNQLLRDIIANKRSSLSTILKKAPNSPVSEKLPFRQRLIQARERSRTALIAEIKKGSPTRGVMLENFDPAQIAAQYSEGGATALSVLTDEKYFFGAAENVRLAKEAAACPVLCKDFFVDPAQMNWARSIGADAALLIVRILSDQQLSELLAAASEADLDVLVETHTESEFERAQEAGADMIGVNNRDLDTLAVDLDVSMRLSERIPDGVLAVTESGIRSRSDIVKLTEAGYGAFLVGESLIMADDRVSALRDLLGESVL